MTCFKLILEPVHLRCEPSLALPDTDCPLGLPTAPALLWACRSSSSAQQTLSASETCASGTSSPCLGICDKCGLSVLSTEHVTSRWSSSQLSVLVLGHLAVSDAPCPSSSLHPLLHASPSAGAHLPCLPLSLLKFEDPSINLLSSWGSSCTPHSRSCPRKPLLSSVHPITWSCSS